MGEVRNEGRGGLRAVIEEVLATPSTDYVNTLVPPRVNERRRIEELATRILDAIEPLIKQKGSASPDGLDRRFDEVFQFPGPNARMESAEDRIGDLESWRESVSDRLAHHDGLIEGLVGRADAFDLKHVASINRDKDINNAIERIEGRINAPAPEGAQPNPGILGDGLDRRFDEVVMNHPEVQIDKIRIAAERAMQEIVKIAELKAMNLGPNTFNMALREWRYSQ